MSTAAKTRSYSLAKGKYLSSISVINDVLQANDLVVLDAPPGTGKSTGLLKKLIADGTPFVFAADTKALAEQLGRDFDLPVFHSRSKKVGPQVVTIHYWVLKIREALKTHPLKDRVLILDEYHSLVTDMSTSYRYSVVRDIQAAFSEYKRTVGLTACHIYAPADWSVFRVNVSGLNYSVDGRYCANPLAALIGEIKARPKDRHFVSIFDKRKAPPTIMKNLSSQFKEDEFFVLNADTIHGADAKAVLDNKEIPKTTKIVICTYRQGFSVNDSDFVCHLVPSGLIRHSAEDVLQVTQRFRNGTKENLIYGQFQELPVEPVPNIPFPRSYFRKGLCAEALKLSNTAKRVSIDDPARQRRKMRSLQQNLDAVKPGSPEEKRLLLVDDNHEPDGFGIEHLLYRMRSRHTHSDEWAMMNDLNKRGVEISSWAKAVEDPDFVKVKAKSNGTGKGGFFPKVDLSRLAILFRSDPWGEHIFNKLDDGTELSDEERSKLEKEQACHERYMDLFMIFANLDVVDRVFCEFCTSSRRWETLMKMIHYQTSEDPVIVAVRNAMRNQFTKGEFYTNDEIFSLTRSALKSISGFKDKPKDRGAAVTFFGMMFKTKDTTDNNERRVYYIIDYDPFEGGHSLGGDPDWDADFDV